MAYRDPYTDHNYGRYDQPYTDTPGFSTYNTQQPHQAYDQGGYDPYAAAAVANPEDTNYGNPANSESAPAHRKSESLGGQGAFGQPITGNSRLRDLRHWRREYHGALWTKGSRMGCIGRFCCCTLMVIVFIIVSIILPLLLWTRPPNILFGDVQLSSNGSDIQLLSNGVQINLGIPIAVNNPNFFSVSFSSITSNIYYPINNTFIGQGQENDITFHSHTNTSFTFPFSIEYTTNMTSATAIVSDLVSKCGYGGGTVSDITVNYDLTLDLRVFFFTASPTISSSTSFECPLTESDLAGLVESILGGIL